jgi:hypothetical protein
LAVRTLVSNKEREFLQLKNQAISLEESLRTIRKAQTSLPEEPISNGNYLVNFTVKSADQTFAQYEKMLRHCKREILLVWSTFGLHTHYQNGLFYPFKECFERGISIRGITEISNRHHQEKVEWAKIVNFRYQRSLEEALRYLIVDSSELLLAINRIPCDIGKLAALCTNNRTVVRGFEVDFYNLWNSSSLADQ